MNISSLQLFDDKDFKHPGGEKEQLSRGQLNA